jgi:hypothetical protein
MKPLKREEWEEEINGLWTELLCGSHNKEEKRVIKDKIIQCWKNQIQRVILLQQKE